MAKVYICVYCEKKFRTNESLKNHIIKFGTHV